MAKTATVWPTPLSLEELLESFRRLVLILREKDIRAPTAPVSTGWSVTATALRTITASNTTASQVAQFVGTLVEDLKTNGFLA